MIPAKIMIIIIPVIIIIYLININFLLDQTFTQHYDIGNEKNYLYPSSRISEKYDNQRDLIDQLVYFEINIPKNPKTVTVQIKLKSNFPEGGDLRLGAADQEGWHYKWHKIYTQTENNNDWKIISTTFNIEEENLKIRNGKLSFVFNTPHLAQEEYKNYTIPIDYINITIYKPGLL